MNERIEELAQCNERILNFFQTGPVQRAAIEEFAELIVRECCDVLYDNEMGGYRVNHVLKEHFGVEE
jgi:hypothetical protein